MSGWIDPRAYGVHSRQYLGHTFRYHLATGFLGEYDTVVDVACGVGYGSNIIYQTCKTVIGFDIDETALKIASDRYPHILFKQVDLNKAKFVDVDSAVSFETLEHLQDPEQFIRNLKESVGKMIILSTPIVPTKHINENHLHDFTENQVLEMLLGDGWTLYEKVYQGPYLIAVVYRK